MKNRQLVGLGIYFSAVLAALADPVGVHVNGRDISEKSGDGWVYSNATHLVLTGKGPFIITGSNAAEAAVMIMASNDVYVVASNLTLSAIAFAKRIPFSCGYHEVTFAFAGTNFLWAGNEGCGIETVSNEVGFSTLALTNLTPDAFLEVKGGASGAGIGHCSGGTTNFLSAGRITLWGGTVRAVGGNYAPGIDRGEVTIRAGRLAVEGGSEAAGIGGGKGGRGGTVRVLGGEVSAKGGAYGAGIGGGNSVGDDFPDGGELTVSGGRVVATGNLSAAGIGGGKHGAGGKVTVTGGEVIANGGTAAAGIGGGGNYFSGAGQNGKGGPGGTTHIRGGRVRAHGDKDRGACDIGHGAAGEGDGANRFTGGSVWLDNGAIALAPSNETRRVWCVAFSNVLDQAALASSLSKAGYETNGIASTHTETYAWLPDGDYTFEAGEQTFSATVAGANAVAAIAPIGITLNGEPIVPGTSGEGWSFVDGTNLVLTGDGVYWLSGSNILAAATNRFSIQAATDCSVVFSNLTIDVSPFKNLCPFDCGTNAVALAFAGTNFLVSGQNCPAIAVLSNEFGMASLSLSGYTADACLSVTGNVFGAGIGTGGSNQTAGAVTILSGTVRAVGGLDAAGIGGGFWGNGGPVNISGGNVDAIASHTASGIGGGHGGAGGTVTISGGTVYAAHDGEWYRDIGGWCSANPGTTTFLGGCIQLPLGEGRFNGTNFTEYIMPSNGKERIHGVTLSNVTATAEICESLASYGYGTDGIQPLQNNVYVWLPAGEYTLAWTEVTTGGATISRLESFGITASGEVSAVTNVNLRILKFNEETVTRWNPESLQSNRVETLYSTNLTDWIGTRPENVQRLFMRLRTK